MLGVSKLFCKGSGATYVSPVGLPVSFVTIRLCLVAGRQVGSTKLVDPVFQSILFWKQASRSFPTLALENMLCFIEMTYLPSEFCLVLIGNNVWLII